MQTHTPPLLLEEQIRMENRVGNKGIYEVWLAQKLRLKSPSKLRVNNEKLTEEVLLLPEFTSVGTERS